MAITFSSFAMRLLRPAAMRYGYLSAAVTRILKVVTPQTTGDGVFYVEAATKDDGEIKYHPSTTARAR